ncbi:TlyA family RNA methyltransferase [Lutibaculum baratangense]|uniref:RNA binding methyltransferase n=1 Tax=Lutibaculum baratangense AMV1 TaxID=631454 RepID=V4QYB2_9HYPH|nr:TlyA family RNA methyltransferase [Lutibaculum baratangense]ESR24747.1 RNA binding methyltransferase [Lutibaculum baratangense AMV1]
MRLDEALVARGLSPSRARARDTIKRGCVCVDGRAVVKPAAPVRDGQRIEVEDPAGRYVSRAALKLAAALEAFALDPAGAICLDLGASTGGFTQVLLERGARRVFALDVGHDQLAESLRREPRVVSHEGVNARTLSRTEVPEAPRLIVADLSFISLRLALPPALALAAPGAVLVALVKPQFELGRDALDKAGVVKDEAAASRLPEEMARWLESLGWQRLGAIVSPVKGGSGNTEYLIGARRA